MSQNGSWYYEQFMNGYKSCMAVHWLKFLNCTWWCSLWSLSWTRSWTLTLLHSERSKLYAILAFLSATGLSSWTIAVVYDLIALSPCCEVCELIPVGSWCAWLVHDIQLMKIGMNWMSVLTLIAPNKNFNRWHFNLLLLSLEENKAWFFMWILDSLETSSLIFFNR